MTAKSEELARRRDEIERRRAYGLKMMRLAAFVKPETDHEAAMNVKPRIDLLRRSFVPQR